jgi:hypothetical protein
MARVRREPRVERNAALGHLLRAAIPTAVLVLILRNRDGLEDFVAELSPSSGLRWSYVTIGIALAAAIAAFYLAAAAWRIYKWAMAHRYRRMLRDPSRAASVPPLESHLTTLRRSQGQGKTAFGFFAGALLAAVFVGRTVWGDAPSDDGSSDDPGVGDLVVLIAIGCGALVVWIAAVRRWWRARRAEDLSEDADLGAGPAPEVSTRRANVIPSLEVSIARTFGDLATAPTRHPVTATTNVFGRPPWNLAYLRLFDNEGRLEQFLGGSWRECGYVHLIRSATSVRAEEIEAAEDGRPVFINSRDWLLAELAAQPLEPLPSTGYPVRSLLCHSSYWKSALDVLLERMDVVALDLSGYQQENLGTGYELQRLVDRFPMTRCVLLADPLSDLAFLEAQVQAAWSRMADGSPNAGDQPREILVAVTGGVMTGSTSRALPFAVQRRLDHVPVPLRSE